MTNHSVYKNVRFKDLIPGETVRVRFKAFSNQGDKFSTRELQYSSRNFSALGQMYHFIDVGTGQLISMYRRLTETLLWLVDRTQEGVILILYNTSRLQYTYRLGAARGRDL